MKRIVLVLMFLNLASISFSQTSSINLTFSGSYDSTIVDIDSIKIINLTQGVDTMLYGSDTILELNYSVGIDNFIVEQNYFSLSQPYPNPFISYTNFDVCVPEDGKASIGVFDVNGKFITGIEKIVRSGKNTFLLRLSEEGLYILSVTFNDKRSSCKIYSLGTHSDSKNELLLISTNNDLPHTKSSTGINGFSFNIGDELNLIGYFQNFIDTITITPLQDTIINFNFQQPLCPSNFIDSRDNHSYVAVLIGTQCWMAENLAYLPSVSPSDSGSSVDYYYYVYDYQDTSVIAAKATNNYQVYGVIYNWAAAMNGELSSNGVPSGVKGVCPYGWHLPSDEEWKILEGEVDSQFGYPDSEWDGSGWRGFDAGGNLKETGTVHWNTPNTGATNNSGFSALPGGGRGSFGSFGEINLSADFWTSTESNAQDAIRRSLYYNTEQVSRSNGDNKVAGRSVRCVKN